MPDSLLRTFTDTPSAPLLVAAVALLMPRCARNDLHAARLLTRAALAIDLSKAERETCLRLAEELAD